MGRGVFLYFLNKGGAGTGIFISSKYAEKKLPTKAGSLKAVDI